MTLAQMKAELEQIGIELDALVLDAQVVELKRRVRDLITAIP